MKIRSTPEADDNPLAAVWLDSLFNKAASRPDEFPMMGRQGKIAGTRELIPHENYRLVYDVTGETAWILALVSTARLWPPLLRAESKP